MANHHLRPKPFDGSKEQNVEDFLHSFECYSNFADWNERKKTRALMSMLVDNAARWLQRQELPDDIAYADLVQMIRDKYNLTPAQRFHLRNELSSIKQHQDEPVDEYAERIEQLCNKIRLDDPDIQTHHFVTGLKPNIRQHVIRVQPDDMEAALNAARAEEGAQSIVHDTNKTPTKSSNLDIDLLVQRLATALRPQSSACSDVAAVKEFHPPDNVVCQLCGIPRHTAPQCPSLHVHQRYQEYRPPCDRRQIQCYNCNEFGHYRRECPKQWQEPYDASYNYDPRGQQQHLNARGPAPRNK